MKTPVFSALVMISVLVMAGSYGSSAFADKPQVTDEYDKPGISTLNFGPVCGAIEAISTFKKHITVTEWSGNDMVRITLEVNAPVTDENGVTVGTFIVNETEQGLADDKGAIKLQFKSKIDCLEGKDVKLSKPVEITHNKKI
jgi:hypothetical protein